MPRRETTRPSNSHLESQLEAYLRTEVRKKGGVAIKWVPVVRGLPDRIVIMPGGRIYFIELKANGGRVSDAQVVWHERLRGLGCDVLVLTGRREIDWFLVEYLESAEPKFRGDAPAVKVRLRDLIREAELGGHTDASGPVFTLLDIRRALDDSEKP